MFTDHELAMKMQYLLIEYVLPAPKPREADLMNELMKDRTEVNGTR